MLSVSIPGLECDLFFGSAVQLVCGFSRQFTHLFLCHAVTFCFISGGCIPLVVSLLEIIRHNMFAAVTFATVSTPFTVYFTSHFLSSHTMHQTCV